MMLTSGWRRGVERVDDSAMRATLTIRRMIMKGNFRALCVCGSQLSFMPMTAQRAGTIIYMNIRGCDVGEFLYLYYYSSNKETKQNNP
jgi:hypothetical protein